jgi:type VI secretion system FHA domain protein
MPLTLTAINYRGRPCLENAPVVFTDQGGTLGRSPDNDLVLHDPDKVISRVHATIRCENGLFFLTDTSMAGTVIVNRNLSLHQDAAPLEDGDHLMIGDYELLVALSGQQEPLSPPPFFSQPSFVRDSPPAGFTPETASSPEDLELEQLLKHSGNAPESDFFGGSLPASPVSSHDAEFLHVAAHQESFTPPESIPTAGSFGIPKDFNPQDLLQSLNAPTVPEEPGDFPDIPPPPPPGKQPDEPVQNEPPAQASEPLVLAVMPPPLQEAPVFREEPPASPPADNLPPPSEEKIATISPAPAPPPPSPAPALEHGQDAGDLAAPFFEALGIEHPQTLPPEELIELMKVAGALIREMTGGLMTMLRGRMELKNQFRVSRTMLSPVKNNPLKFSPSTEDALKLLFIDKKPGFLQPLEAVQQGFRDVMNHEMAMTAANQATLLSLLKQFDPENFSQKYNEGFVLQKKTKCWDSYCHAYPAMIQKIQDNIFGEDFVRAYEEQIQRLQASNMKER